MTWCCYLSCHAEQLHQAIMNICLEGEKLNVNQRISRMSNGMNETFFQIRLIRKLTKKS
jgi:hypothetical protein